MELDLAPETEKLINETVKAGRFSSAEALVQAAIDRFLRDENDFESGELERLIAIGTRQLDRGEGLDGTAVFNNLRKSSAAYRAGGRP